VQAQAKTYKVGDTGPGGGIVFFDKFDNAGGWRYLEAAPEDIVNLFAGVQGADYNGITKRGVGTGKANTQAIIGKGGFGLAAHACRALTINGYNDWFVPSRDELNYMYDNLHQKGLGNFRSGGYWSSTNATVNLWNRGETFCVKDFSDGKVYEEIAGHLYRYRVRACRQF
jgi:hypothetical protein